jgi:hypothetical protein
MIRTVRSASKEWSAAVRQAAASDLPLHGCPHMMTSAMDDQETFGGDKNDEQMVLNFSIGAMHPILEKKS